MNVLERSLVSDYEGKLHKKKEEVAELLKEREELRATHKRLRALQKKMHFRQVWKKKKMHPLSMLGGSLIFFVTYFFSQYLDESTQQNGGDQEVVSQT